MKGATPAQVKVGVQLALGKTKPQIAAELDVKLSSVADLTRKLYQTLDVHNFAELGAGGLAQVNRMSPPSTTRPITTFVIR